MSFKKRNSVDLSYFSKFTFSQNTPILNPSIDMDHNCDNNLCKKTKVTYTYPNLLFFLNNFRHIFLNGQEDLFPLLNKLGSNTTVLKELLTSLMNIIDSISSIKVV